MRSKGAEARAEWLPLDEGLRYLHSLNVKMGDNVLHCLIDCRLLDYEVELDHELDAVFDGKVLVFSASAEKCGKSQVHKLSGDLDGDDYLCVVQRDLLPLKRRDRVHGVRRRRAAQDGGLR